MIRDRIVDFQRVRAGDILPHPKNWRTHSDKQRAIYGQIVDEIGFAGALLTFTTEDGQLMLIDGHLRQDEHPDELLPTLITDLTADEAEQILATYDPISGLAGIRLERMQALFDGLQGRRQHMADLLEEAAARHKATLKKKDVVEDPGAQIDRAEELQKKWQVERGQVWEIPSLALEGSAHRVMCGDSTDEADVARLLDGDNADTVVTDPPYGIRRDKGFEGFEGFGGFGAPIARTQYSGDWDSERPTKQTFDLILSYAPIALIFGGNFFADFLPVGNHWIVWDKLNTMPTFGDCELIWTNVARNSVKKIVFQYNGLMGKENKRYHATQKPAGLLAEIIKAYTDNGGVVLDSFLGSGTTIVACEQTGRLGRGMEIDPKYVAVTLERLAEMGLEPYCVGK